MEGRGVGLRPVTEPFFDWKDYGRFVEVYAVSSGWLVLWGRYERMGNVRATQGMRIYRDAAGVRRRIGAAVQELTGKPVDARDAQTLFDARGGLPAHAPRERQPAQDPSPNE